MITDFEQLTRKLRDLNRRVRVAAVCPRDHSSEAALAQAHKEGWAEPIVIDHDDQPTAAREAVAAVRRGEADVLMKGLISSDVLLRAVLSKEDGLLSPGHVLTHIAVAQMAGYHKLVAYSDAAVIPYPTQEQRSRQIAYLVALCHSLGIAEPRVSLIHCSEKADGRHFPFTEGYALLAAQAREGAYGRCVVDGPLDVKTSMCAESMRVKGIHRWRGRCPGLSRHRGSQRVPQDHHPAGRGAHSRRAPGPRGARGDALAWRRRPVQVL